MKAIPMRNRLTGKRVAGYIWAGPGKSFTRKENYFQLEDKDLVSVALYCSSGSFWIRCKGTTCEIKLLGRKGQVLGTTTLTLPHGRR